LIVSVIALDLKIFNVSQAHQNVGCRSLPLSRRLSTAAQRTKLRRQSFLAAAFWRLCETTIVEATYPTKRSAIQPFENANPHFFQGRNDIVFI
jgi:hypothetical protein